MIVWDIDIFVKIFLYKHMDEIFYCQFSLKNIKLLKVFKFSNFQETYLIWFKRFRLLESKKY